MIPNKSIRQAKRCRGISIGRLKSCNLASGSVWSSRGTGHALSAAASLKLLLLWIPVAISSATIALITRAIMTNVANAGLSKRELTSARPSLGSFLNTRKLSEHSKRCARPSPGRCKRTPLSASPRPSPERRPQRSKKKKYYSLTSSKLVPKRAPVNCRKLKAAVPLNQSTFRTWLQPT